MAYDIASVAGGVKTATSQRVFDADAVSIVVGTVVSIEPLGILLDDEQVVEGDSLVVLRNVTDYSVEMEVEHETEEAFSEIEEKKHEHEYKGKKSFNLLTSLKLDERVVLIKQQGADRFFLFDRVLEH